LRRIAFFVEGYTEQKFLETLITEIFTGNDIAIEIRNMRGGAKARITTLVVSSSVVSTSTKYFILIYNCGGDSNVRSYIEDQRQSLISNGYELIIGFRDVYPIAKADIQRLRSGLLYRLPQKPTPIVFLLSVMEIEAWFLAEETHFAKIDPAITVEAIRTNLGFDVQVDNMEDRLNPASDLDDIYKLAGKRYNKSASQIDRTCSCLDYARVYIDLTLKFPSLQELVAILESLFAN